MFPIVTFVPRLLIVQCKSVESIRPQGGWGILPYMGYIGMYMCRCDGYDFQAVLDRNA